ncbi:MAG: PhaM family polyhydroxyalkanoate granule multifunctional regulatory protein [Betaproteobacteria bacterium]|jgi:hypothetical protein
MSDESGKKGGDAPAFSAQDAMAFMQRMWNPFAMPMPGSAAGAVEPTDAAATSQPAPTEPEALPGMMPGMFAFPNPAAMFAALDPAQVERKVAELRVIENWLAMSLNLTQMSIRTLELQRASLEALQASSAPAAKGEGKSRKR